MTSIRASVPFMCLSARFTSALSEMHEATACEWSRIGKRTRALARKRMRAETQAREHAGA